MHTNHDAPPNSDINPEAAQARPRTGPDQDPHDPVCAGGDFLYVRARLCGRHDNHRKICAKALKPLATDKVAAGRNNVAINEQLNRISSTDPKADVRQPRWKARNFDDQEPAVYAVERPDEGGQLASLPPGRFAPDVRTLEEGFAGVRLARQEQGHRPHSDHGGAQDPGPRCRSH